MSYSSASYDARPSRLIPGGPAVTWGGGGKEFKNVVLALTELTECEEGLKLPSRRPYS